MSNTRERWMPRPVWIGTIVGLASYRLFNPNFESHGLNFASWTLNELAVQAAIETSVVAILLFGLIELWQRHRALKRAAFR